jgi:electron transfer flavoprotein alpha/beta subunit
MNILVCIKQVPDTTEIKINPETNTLMREGVPSIVNTFDAYALELGVRLKEKHGIIIDEETPSASVQKLMKLITDKKVI